MEEIIHTKDCAHDWCRNKIEITERDRGFYKKMGVPEPIMCFPCRQQLKLSFRNERKLYHNKCGLCHKPIVTINSSDKSCPVYCTTCWWGDGWDPMNYGRDFDFERPFFEQVRELFEAVPKLALLVLGDNVNSDYTHDAYRLENCYLTFDGEQAKDCYYGETFARTKDCMDFFAIKDSELCYEVVNCKECYNLNFSRYCQNCSDSSFLLNCKGCRNCFGCVNLQQKEYHIFNKPHSPEEYKRIVGSYNLSGYSNLEKFKKEIEAFFLGFPRKYMNGVMNENSTGDNLNGCKDCTECYDCENSRDCKYCTNMLMGGNDCYDVNIWGDNLSLAFNCVAAGAGSQNVIGSFYAGVGAYDVYHSLICMNNNRNLLGCVGLRQKKFCILNKQYTEEGWEQMFEKIKAYMKQTGEWGEFFPASVSPFGYNETMAQEYYPLTKEEALERGFKWRDPDPKEYATQTHVTPEDISEVNDEILNKILACNKCGKNFKLVPQELKLYRQKGFPLPRKCCDCRHLDRLALKNPRQLWDRKCAKCNAEIKTSYAPERPEKVYCEKCYLEEVY